MALPKCDKFCVDYMIKNRIRQIDSCKQIDPLPNNCPDYPELKSTEAWLEGVLLYWEQIWNINVGVYLCEVAHVWVLLG